MKNGLWSRSLSCANDGLEGCLGQQTWKDDEVETEQKGGMFCYLVYTERWDLVTSSIGPHADMLHIMSDIMLAAGTAPGSSPVLVRTRRLKDRVTSNRDKDSNSILNLAC